MLWPFSELRKHDYNVDVVMYPDLRRINIDPYDIILTPRVTFDGTHWLYKWLNNAQKAGKVWLYECDDDLFSDEFVERQVDHQAAGEDRAERRRIHAAVERERDQRITILKHCDGITVSSHALAGCVRALTSTPVIVVPNLIDAQRFNRYLHRRERMIPAVTIGWAGGGRLNSDLTLLGQAWSILARRYPDVTFVVYGHEPEPLIKAVSSNQLAVIDWSPIELYPAGLANIDIGCCVLPDTSWNRSKSPNKWFEHTLAGAACVVSPTVYGEVVQDGHDALVATTIDDWIVQIKRLIDSHELRTQIATHARMTVKTKHNLNVAWQQWPSAWSAFTAKSSIPK